MTVSLEDRCIVKCSLDIYVPIKALGSEALARHTQATYDTYYKAPSYYFFYFTSRTSYVQLLICGRMPS